MTTVPEPLPAEGFAVRLVAAFLGFRRFPLLAITHSSASPPVVLHDDHVVCGLVRGRRVAYGELEAVDVHRAWRTESLHLVRHNALLVLAANVGDADLLAALLDFFARRGVALSPRARSFLQERKKKEAPHAGA